MTPTSATTTRAPSPPTTTRRTTTRPRTWSTAAAALQIWSDFSNEPLKDLKKQFSGGHLLRIKLVVQRQAGIEGGTVAEGVEVHGLVDTRVKKYKLMSL